MTDTEIRQIMIALAEIRGDQRLLHAKVDGLKEQVDGIKSSYAWIWKTVGAFLIIGLLTMLYASGGKAL